MLGLSKQHESALYTQLAEVDKWWCDAKCVLKIRVCRTTEERTINLIVPL